MTQIEFFVIVLAMSCMIRYDKINLWRKLYLGWFGESCDNTAGWGRGWT